MSSAYDGQWIKREDSMEPSERDSTPASTVSNATAGAPQFAMSLRSGRRVQYIDQRPAASSKSRPSKSTLHKPSKVTKPSTRESQRVYGPTMRNGAYIVEILHEGCVHRQSETNPAFNLLQPHEQAYLKGTLNLKHVARVNTRALGLRHGLTYEHAFYRKRLEGATMHNGDLYIKFSFTNTYRKFSISRGVAKQQNPALVTAQQFVECIKRQL